MARGRQLIYATSGLTISGEAKKNTLYSGILHAAPLSDGCSSWMPPGPARSDPGSLNASHIDNAATAQRRSLQRLELLRVCGRARSQAPGCPCSCVRLEAWANWRRILAGRSGRARAASRWVDGALARRSPRASPCWPLLRGGGPGHI